jgi:hypothetical protein
VKFKVISKNMATLFLKFCVLILEQFNNCPKVPMLPKTLTLLEALTHPKVPTLPKTLTLSKAPTQGANWLLHSYV